MGEEYQGGICGGTWWNSSKTMFTGCSSPGIIADMGSFGWGSTATDHHHHHHHQKPHHQQQQQADSVDSGGSTSLLIDSTLQMMGFGLSSSAASDWNQPLLNGRNESYNSIIHEDIISSRSSNCGQETAGMDSCQIGQKEWSPGEDSSITTTTTTTTTNTNTTFNPAMNQEFSLSSRSVTSSAANTTTPTCQGLSSPGGPGLFPMASASYGYPSSTVLLQSLFEPEPEPDPQPQPQPQPLFNNRSINYMSSAAASYGANTNDQLSSPNSWPKLAPFLKAPAASLPKQQQQPSSLHFSNNTAFWNASATGLNDVKASFLPSPQSQFLVQTFEEKPKKNNKTEEVRDSGTKKANNHEPPPFKRPRIETPSPLPTFKVRKEKLGDRITALQQLVSPFGKTDTASVLHEAIEYIKFLHDQVNVLSTPYMKQAAASIQQQSNDKLKEGGEVAKQDLRSRGLCLVPISSTFPVANETTADFWTPTFGGSFR